MKNMIGHKATASATLLISTEPGAEFRPKPSFRDDFEISEAGYGRLPAAFTLTELPLPAVVAADSIENYDTHLAAIPEEERAELDLDQEGRWEDETAVQRFINRALAVAFEGEHFTVTGGLEHIQVASLYLINPTYSFSLADRDGSALDLYSAPAGFEQPIRIEARINVNSPSAIEGL